MKRKLIECERVTIDDERANIEVDGILLGYEQSLWNTKGTKKCDLKYERVRGSYRSVRRGNGIVR